MQWFRMWGEAVDDEKLRLLAFEDRWHFVAILCLKAQGILDEPDTDLRRRKIAVKLGLTIADCETAMKRIETVGLVSPAWQPIKWDKRQFVSDSSTKRVRKFRERQRNVSVTHSENRLQKQITDTERTKNLDRRTACAVEPMEFVQLRREYPKRSGGQRWGDALRFFKRRVAEGENPETILAGVKRYAEFARATGIERTERVQQAATFLGDNRGYLEQWHPPPRAKSAVEQAREELRRSVGEYGDGTVVSEQKGPPAGSSDLGSFARLLR